MIPYKKMSPYLVQALVATEDERFYEHSGIDFRALGRAIIKRGIWGRLMLEGVLPLLSSWLNSCIVVLRKVLLSECSRNQ